MYGSRTRAPQLDDSRQMHGLRGCKAKGLAMNIELAKRAVACKHWRWMAGMLTTDDFRVTAIHPDGLPHGEYSQVGPLLWKINAEHMPDLNDPATLGCLLALVREVWGKPEVFVQSYWSKSICDEYGIFQVGYPSEAELLVAALEAAP